MMRQIRTFTHRMGHTRLAVIAVSLAVATLVIGYRAYELFQPEPPAFHTGVMRVAVDPSLPPSAYFDDNGDLVGLDIDLARALGDELGLPVDIQIYGIDGLYDALLNDNVDVIISAIQPQAWRMGDVAYTRGYFDAGLVLVTPSGSDIKQMRDMPGHSLAYAFGSSADAETRVWSRRIDPFESRPYELPEVALDGVRLGEADAALVDAVSARLYLRDHPGWDAQVNYVTHAPLVIAVRIHRVGTFREVSAALDNLFEAGVIGEIINCWM